MMMRIHVNLALATTVAAQWGKGWGGNYGGNSIPSVDVAVVGAGFSGLSAAENLIKGGLSVAVIEARDRVGGRVLNAHLKNGGVQEMGAEFVGPTQDR